MEYCKKVSFDLNFFLFVTSGQIGYKNMRYSFGDGFALRPAQLRFDPIFEIRFDPVLKGELGLVERSWFDGGGFGHRGGVARGFGHGGGKFLGAGRGQIGGPGQLPFEVHGERGVEDARGGTERTHIRYRRHSALIFIA